MKLHFHSIKAWGLVAAALSLPAFAEAPQYPDNNTYEPSPPDQQQPEQYAPPQQQYVPPPRQPSAPQQQYQPPPQQYAPQQQYVPPPRTYVAQPQPYIVRRPPPVRTTLLLEGGGGGDFASLAANVNIQQGRWSLLLDGRTLLIPDAVGNIGSRFNMFDATVGFAPWTARRFRFQFDLGALALNSPNAWALGPYGGATMKIGLGGPFGIEGGIHGVPFPFRELDWNAAMGLSFGPLALLGGWRQTFIDDLSGQPNFFSGPYLAVALLF